MSFNIINVIERFNSLICVRRHGHQHVVRVTKLRNLRLRKQISSFSYTIEHNGGKVPVITLVWNSREALPSKRLTGRES